MSAPAQKAPPSLGQDAGDVVDDHRPPTTPKANVEVDLLAGLWQVAPFTRLPPDAPEELQKYVRDVENPRCVYAIYRASRRHDFQLLVERYVYQLRIGCGIAKCSTATCFTCRKGLSGKAPIRRYNPSSARTLAVYLASQDNPENGLCPYLEVPKDGLHPLDALSFATRPSTKPHLNCTDADARTTTPRRKMAPGADTRVHCSLASKKSDSPSTASRKGEQSQSGEVNKDNTYNENLHATQCETCPPIVTVSEKPSPRDYRSFAVATFGTVAFKMLEWLTPQSMENMTEAVSELYGSLKSSTANSAAEPAAEPVEPARTPDPPSGENKPPDSSRNNSLSKPDISPKSSKPAAEETREPQVPPENSRTSKDLPRPRKNSKTTLRSSTSKPSSRRPLEPVSISGGGPEEVKATSKPPSLNPFYHDKLSRTPKPTNGVINRGVPDIPTKPAFFENVPAPTPTTVKEVTAVESGLPERDEKEAKEAINNANTSIQKDRVEPLSKPKTVPPSTGVDLDSAKFPWPQSLSKLNVELIEFMCDVFQKDHTSEQQFFGPLAAHVSYPKPQNWQSKLTRRRAKSKQSSVGQWKSFNEQVLFSVLSDPDSIVKSFSEHGEMYDSHTLWYCMLRLTRAAPSLVLHSLWMAAESLFTVPKSLQSSNSAMWKRFSKSGRSVSPLEAGCLMSICLHALVAVVPYVSDSKTLYDMSRIRSTGLVLGGNGLSTRQPHSMCLEYEDVFSNEFAMRLARRLFAAISARRFLADMFLQDGRGKQEYDVLQLLLSQLDLMNSGPIRVLEFTQAERLLHETRVPTLLLDWARAVLLNDWNGKPEIDNSGPFHGALSLISTMYENRNVLLLGDIQFRVDYFSERIDTMEMPVSWVDSISTREKSHILDYPYLFSPESLVTFFRSINFARMSRMFEESSSLKTRMKAIVDPGSLITNQHHKVVLQDLLKTASSKYLVLDIGRENVLRDAFDQLWRRQQRELLRPLKVHLGEDGGEEGFDSGGVQQEFFRMAIAECMDPQYGAFTIDERTRMAWFAPSSAVEEWKFELTGILVSLAVYNGLTLPVTFPKALYRKLLGDPVEELYHIADGWPDLASGLMTLLEWDEKDGLVEDIFARTYEFSVPSIGGNLTRWMTRTNSKWPQTLDPTSQKITVPEESEGTDEAPLVTNDNRDQYVNDYIRYLTDVSVQPQYRAFERGFKRCLMSKSLSLLSPQILQSVVEGVQEIDISELRRYTRYVGWDSSHHTVKDFWSVVKRFDDRMKRKLLEFVTASDRVPVGGMRNLQFVVQRNGEEESDHGHLPTAYTCYGTLLLPEYRDKEALKERLLMALENAQGFGFA